MARRPGLPGLGAAVLAVVTAAALTACGAHSGTAGGSGGLFGISSGVSGGGSGSGAGTGAASQHDAFGKLIQTMSGRTSSNWSVRMTGTINGSVSGQTLNMSFTGDSKQDSSGLGMQAQYRMDIAGQHLDVTMVLAGDTLYLKFPASMGLPADKPWVKISKDGSDPMSRQLGSMLDQLKQSGDPRQMLQLLQDNDAVTVRNTAQDTVDGRPTTRYDVTVDVPKMVASQGSKLNGQLRQLVEQSGIKTMDMSVWVDNANLPAKIVLTEPIPGAGSVNMQMTMSNWGEPVTITVPSDDQIGRLPGH